MRGAIRLHGVVLSVQRKGTGTSLPLPLQQNKGEKCSMATAI